MKSVPDDFAAVWDKQVYRYVGLCEHAKADGTVIHMLAWDTECPTCGGSFTVRALNLFAAPCRRCDGCKHIRMHVKTERKSVRKLIREAVKA